MKYFTIKELCASDSATANKIDNTPDQPAIANMTELVENLLDPLREKYGYPINCNSGYRSKALNAKVGGASNSCHLYGQAADLKIKRLAYNAIEMRKAHKKLISIILDNNLPYDKIIWEYGDDNGPQWLHVSFRKGANRKQIWRIRTKSEGYFRCDRNGNKI